MDEETPAGVEAFARYFVAVAERAWNTGDTTELEAISSRECTYCSNLTTLIHDRYRAHQWTDGLEYRVSSAETPVLFPQEKAKYVILLRVVSGSGVYSTGTSVRSITSRSETLEMHICRDGSDWLTCEAIGTEDAS